MQFMYRPLVLLSTKVYRLIKHLKLCNYPARCFYAFHAILTVNNDIILHMLNWHAQVMNMEYVRCEVVPWFLNIIVINFMLQR